MMLQIKPQNSFWKKIQDKYNNCYRISISQYENEDSQMIHHSSNTDTFSLKTSKAIKMLES